MKRLIMAALCGAALTATAWGQTNPAQHNVKRNPFVPPLSGARPIPPEPVHPSGSATTHSDKVPHLPPPTAQEPAVPAPPFSLAGIVQSARGTEALLGDKVSRTVEVGDVVAGYKVTAIDMKGRAVTVSMRNHAFKLIMPLEKQ